MNRVLLHRIMIIYGMMILGTLDLQAQNADLDFVKQNNSPKDSCCIKKINKIRKNNPGYPVSMHKNIEPGDKSIYDRIHIMNRVNDPSFYLGYTTNNIRNEPIDPELDIAEGKYGYLLELQLANRFSVFKLKPSKHKGFWLLPRATIDFEFTYRIANGKDSGDSPGLPLNTKVGASFEIPFPIGQSCYTKKDNSSIVPKFNTNNLKTPLHLVTPKLQFMHYSNGQDLGARKVDSVLTSRNDYATGNFSTNYMLGQVDYTVMGKNNRIFNAFIGYRQDFAVGGLLAYEEAQNHRYGFNRLVFGAHFRTGPIIKKCVRYSTPEEYKEHEMVNVCSLAENEDQTNQESPKPPIYVERRKLFEIWGRVKFESILDETSLFDQGRTTFTAEVGLSPLNYKTVSFMLQYHYGRDYLNIRYDTKVSNFLLAVTFNLTKYRPSYVSTLITP